MRGDLDEEFKWICHLRDHFSKYSVASPMPNKTSEEVVKVVLNWILHLGPPKILQSDNGTEFKGALTLLLRRHGIQVINGRPRHPQSQGMAEKGNHILKDKIAAWRSDHQSSSWVSSLPEVIAGMNAQQSSVTGKSAYEIAFGQAPHGARISYLERDVEDVPEEGDLTSYHALSRVGDSPAVTVAAGVVEESSVVAPSLISAIEAIPEEALDISLRIGSDQMHQPSLTMATTAQEGARALHEAITMDIRRTARSTAAQSRQVMVTRDLQRNPTHHYAIGSLVTLRIPKKNRNATQNRRLLCQVLAEATPGRYKLQSEHGVLKNTYPAGEIDGAPQTVNFNPKVPAIVKEITLNYASRQDRIGVPAQVPERNMTPGIGGASLSNTPASQVHSTGVSGSVNTPTYFVLHAKVLIVQPTLFRSTVIAMARAMNPIAPVFGTRCHARNTVIRLQRVVNVFVGIQHLAARKVRQERKSCRSLIPARYWIEILNRRTLCLGRLLYDPPILSW